MSGVYNEMIAQGMRIRVFDSDMHISFGTPDEYEAAKKLLAEEAEKKSENEAEAEAEKKDEAKPEEKKETSPAVKPEEKKEASPAVKPEKKKDASSADKSEDKKKDKET